MKKILIWFFMLISTYLINHNSVFAVGANEAEKSKENVSIITSIFSTEMLLNFIFALFVIILTFFLSKIVSSKLSSYMETIADWEWANREELIWVVDRTTSITILVIWFSITLSILWIDMAIFLWWLWFWIWFTLKIFLSNFIGWIIMVTQWTYHNWDIVEIEWKIWKITKIHSLFTSIEQFDWVVYYVPNIKFLEENVSNYHSNDKRRVEVKVGVDYSTDIIKAKKIMLQVIHQFPNILKAPEQEIIIDKLDNSSINLILRFWIDSKDEYFMTKSNVTETVNLAFKQSWIVIPFPQLTLSNRNDFKVEVSK